MSVNVMNEASSELMDSIQEINKAVAESTLTIQQRNMKAAQNAFTNYTEVFKNQADTARNLMQTLGQQSQKQQDATRRIFHQWVDIYMDFLRAPLAFYQHASESGENVMKY